MSKTTVYALVIVGILISGAVAASPFLVENTKERERQAMQEVIDQIFYAHTGDYVTVEGEMYVIKEWRDGQTPVVEKVPRVGFRPFKVLNLRTHEAARKSGLTSKDHVVGWNNK